MEVFVITYFGPSWFATARGSQAGLENLQNDTILLRDSTGMSGWCKMGSFQVLFLVAATDLFIFQSWPNDALGNVCYACATKVQEWLPAGIWRPTVMAYGSLSMVKFFGECCCVQ